MIHYILLCWSIKSLPTKPPRVTRWRRVSRWHKSQWRTADKKSRKLDDEGVVAINKRPIRSPTMTWIFVQNWVSKVLTELFLAGKINAGNSQERGNFLLIKIGFHNFNFLIWMSLASTNHILHQHIPLIWWFFNFRTSEGMTSISSFFV